MVEPQRGFVASLSESLRGSFKLATAQYGSQQMSGSCLHDAVTVAGIPIRKQFLFLARNDSRPSQIGRNWAGSFSLKASSSLALTVLSRASRHPASETIMLAGSDAQKRLHDAKGLRWVRWDPDGRVPGTLTGHYEREKR